MCFHPHLVTGQTLNHCERHTLNCELCLMNGFRDSVRVFCITGNIEPFNYTSTVLPLTLELLLLLNS